MIGIGIGLTKFKNTGVTVLPPPSLLLDTYSGAAAAYSLRGLSTEYVNGLTPYAITVRNGAGNAADIGFVFNSLTGEYDLDITALLAHCDGSNGFVTDWYDQSGNANDATQTTATEQSQIVSSGSVITEGGKPCLEYNDDLYNSTYELTDDTNFLALLVIRVDTQNAANPRYVAFNSSTNSVNVQIGYNSSSKYFTRKDNVTNATTNTFTPQVLRNLLAHGCQSDTTYMSHNGTLQTFTDSGAPNANSLMGNGLFLLKGYEEVSYYVASGNIQEFILYPSDKLSDLSGIETNINDFYSIY